MSKRSKAKLKVVKTKKPAPKKPSAAKEAQGHNSDKRTFDEKRQSFLQHRTAWNGAQAKVKVAKKILDDVVGAAKADGVSKKELQLADQLMGLAGETAVKKEVATRLRIAKYLGLGLGAQLDMFAEPDRTPGVDRAFDEGKQDSMEGKPAKPKHSPETEQYRAYMAGYNEDQERRAGTLGRGNPPDEKDLRPRHLQERDAARAADDTTAH